MTMTTHWTRDEEQEIEGQHRAAQGPPDEDGYVARVTCPRDGAELQRIAVADTGATVSGANAPAPNEFVAYSCPTCCRATRYHVCQECGQAYTERDTRVHEDVMAPPVNYRSAYSQFCLPCWLAVGANDTPHDDDEAPDSGVTPVQDVRHQWARGQMFASINGKDEGSAKAGDVRYGEVVEVRPDGDIVAGLFDSSWTRGTITVVKRAQLSQQLTREQMNEAERAGWPRSAAWLRGLARLEWSRIEQEKVEFDYRHSTPGCAPIVRCPRDGAPLSSPVVESDDGDHACTTFRCPRCRNQYFTID
jgi:hypothetical protein